MKAILILEMPNDCLECPFYDDCLMRCGYLKNEHYAVDSRPADCPLKPLPQKKERELWEGRYKNFYLYRTGWNDCIDEITGETE